MTVSKFRVYEVVCRDKSIQDRYIGYTSMTKQVFPRLWDSASEANLIKEIIINKRPGKYTLNIYKTGKKRAAPTTMEGYDSDEESVATDN